MTPAHFLTGGCDNAILFSTVDNDDTDYFLKLNSTQELLKILGKSETASEIMDTGLFVSFERKFTTGSQGSMVISEKAAKNW